MKRYKAAAIIIMIHGFIETSGFLSMLPVWIFGITPTKLFPIPSIDVMIAGVIWGVLRLTSGIGLLKNLIWGFWLSIINCVIAIMMMMTILPFGIMDGILASIALVLILTQYFGKKKIIE